MSALLGVAIVGCGLIGRKRARALSGCKLVVCADFDFERARALAAEHGADACDDWRKAIAHPGVDAVVVATTHDSLAVVSLAAAEAGKHVLVEKPAARRSSELEPVMEAERKTSVSVRVGFNHRYHPGVLKALELFRSGAVGEMMFVRGRYGHGGRVGYDREWRADPLVSGGGELIDQGMHLIDLSRLFLGDFSGIDGFAGTFFWDMPVDDNGFMILRTNKNRVAFLHASCTEWKNLFSFEIYGKTGKLHIEGLGGSYGTEKLTWHRMLPEMGPPETMSWEYPRGDDSWSLEFREFLEDIRLTRTPSANLRDAFEALRVVERIYDLSGYPNPLEERA